MTEEQLMARLRGESFDELTKRRSLLAENITVIRAERRNQIGESGGVRKVPQRDLDEYDAREHRVNVQLRAVLAALDERMPPNQQRKKNQPKEERDA